MIAVYCSSWVHYVNHKCDHNFETPLGHGALTRYVENIFINLTYFFYKKYVYMYISTHKHIS
jgi:hypothetical protein